MAYQSDNVDSRGCRMETTSSSFSFLYLLLLSSHDRPPPALHPSPGAFNENGVELDLRVAGLRACKRVCIGTIEIFFFL
jgi:hypothetical protein